MQVPTLTRAHGQGPLPVSSRVCSTAIAFNPRTRCKGCVVEGLPVVIRTVVTCRLCDKARATAALAFEM